MKKTILIIVSIVSIFVIYSVIQVVRQQSSGFRVENIDKSNLSDKCTNKLDRSEFLYESSLQSIRKLGDYEKKCKSEFTREIVYKIILPKNTDVQKSISQKTALEITEMRNRDIKPIIYIYPDNSWTSEDFNNAQSDSYDEILNKLFQDLYSSGIDGSYVDKWVILPEANLPYWNSSYITPEVYSNLFNKINNRIKTYYPESKVGVMFDSSTYEDANFSWAEGEYVSHLQYLSKINKSDVKFYIISGYPWTAPAGKSTEVIFNPKEYLSKKQIVEAMNYLEINDLYIETGTFASFYYDSADKKVTIPADIRKQVLEKTFSYASELKKSYNVSIVINQTENKLRPKADWTYWGTEYTDNITHEYAIVDFIKNSKNQNFNIILSL